MNMRDEMENGGVQQLLLLSDHDDIAVAIKMLQDEGYNVQHDNCWRCDLTTQLTTYSPDAILIDLERPTVKSISICRELRCAFDGPILVLAAQANDVIQLLGLEMGADDFLFKPQSDALLLTKLRAFLRRSEELGQRQRKFVQLGDLTIDATRREVWSAGSPVSLTSREFDLLWCLAENVRSILSREEIHQALYKREYNGYDRSIDIYVSRVRQKIGDDPVNPRYLKTVRGSGYLLVEDHP